MIVNTWMSPEMSVGFECIDNCFQITNETKIVLKIENLRKPNFMQTMSFHYCIQFSLWNWHTYHAQLDRIRIAIATKKWHAFRFHHWICSICAGYEYRITCNSANRRVKRKSRVEADEDDKGRWWSMAPMKPIQVHWALNVTFSRQQYAAYPSALKGVWSR